MNDKLKRAKELSHKKDLTVGVFSSKDFKQAIEGFIRDFEGRIAEHDTALSKKQEKLVSDVLEAANTIKEAMQSGVKLKNPELLMQKEEVIVKNLSELKMPTITTEKVDISNLATDKTLRTIKKTMQSLLDEIVSTNKAAQSKTPDDYVPFRRVIKDGNSFRFDDSPSAVGGMSGGGGATTTVYCSVSGFKSKV